MSFCLIFLIEFSTNLISECLLIYQYFCNKHKTIQFITQLCLILSWHQFDQQNKYNIKTMSQYVRQSKLKEKSRGKHQYFPALPQNHSPNRIPADIFQSKIFKKSEANKNALTIYYRIITEENKRTNDTDNSKKKNILNTEIQTNFVRGNQMISNLSNLIRPLEDQLIDRQNFEKIIKNLSTRQSTLDSPGPNLENGSYLKIYNQSLLPSVQKQLSGNINRSITERKLAKGSVISEGEMQNYHLNEKEQIRGGKSRSIPRVQYLRQKTQRASSEIESSERRSISQRKLFFVDKQQFQKTNGINQNQLRMKKQPYDTKLNTLRKLSQPEKEVSSLAKYGFKSVQIGTYAQSISNPEEISLSQSLRKHTGKCGKAIQGNQFLQTLFKSIKQDQNLKQSKRTIKQPSVLIQTSEINKIKKTLLKCNDEYMDFFTFSYLPNHKIGMQIDSLNQIIGQKSCENQISSCHDVTKVDYAYDFQFDNAKVQSSATAIKAKPIPISSKLLRALMQKQKAHAQQKKV